MKSTDLLPHHGCFKKGCCDEFSLQKANMPELTLYYLNQGSLSYKNDEKIFYFDNYILDQIVPLVNLPSNLSTYELKPDEVKILISKYNASTGQFLGIVGTVGQLIAGVIRVRYFSIMGTLRKKSKVLYSTHKIKIPNSFRGGMFTCHKQLYEKGELLTDFSRIYYFISPTTDRTEIVNRHMGHVYLKPIDIAEGEFGEGLNPSMLDEIDHPE